MQLGRTLASASHPYTLAHKRSRSGISLIETDRSPSIQCFSMVVRPTRRLSESNEQTQALLGSLSQVEIVRFLEQEWRSVQTRRKLTTISLRSPRCCSSVESPFVWRKMTLLKRARVKRHVQNVPFGKIDPQKPKLLSAHRR